MDRTQTINRQLAALAAHLAAHSESILREWRKAVARDPEMMTGASLPRAQLNDHIPGLLKAFGQKLLARIDQPGLESRNEHKDDASAHGLQRWQQGYDLREVTREWGRLQLCVADELESYASSHSDVEPTVMATARRAWAEMCADGVSESTARYFHLQQIEAKGQVRDLEEMLRQMSALEHERSILWQEAAHDLRGNLGVIVNASAGLSLRDVSDPLRSSFLRMLNKNVSALHSLLEDVTSLARLQAGQEQRHLTPFDAAAMLVELCERMQPLAAERDLYLNTDGPPQLPVLGDAVKVQRISQNLLLNAIKYTSSGGVTVTWGDSRADDGKRWMLCVQDTGPGFHAGPGAPMAGALEEATEEARHVAEAAGHGDELHAAAAAAPSHADSADTRSVHQVRGEGIGLSIVKRLCELLDATVEMESNPGQGTTVRILFPRSYAATESPIPAT